MTERVGSIGLGVMGRPMARNLMLAGFPPTVHSRSASPTVAITMLHDTPDVELALFDPDAARKA